VVVAGWEGSEGRDTAVGFGGAMLWDGVGGECELDTFRRLFNRGME
jgi:hypothetical protein